MRIVSQDKKIDMPYNGVVYYRKRLVSDGTKHSIEAETSSGVKALLGTYKTEERALEVMDKLRTNNTMSENFKMAAGSERDLLVKTFAKANDISGFEALTWFSYFYMPEE